MLLCRCCRHDPNYKGDTMRKEHTIMKIEMHTHTSQSSPCAAIAAEQTPALYSAAGYDAIVITDHYSKWVWDQSGAATPEEYTDYFLAGYYAAKQAAPPSFPVLLGAEVNLLESPNDYLLYGATEEFFHRNLRLHELSLPALYDLCHANGILLFQAHPYRTYCTPADARFLDGAEYYNGNPRHNNQNELAARWVEEHGLIPSSGSDFHEQEDLAKGGIEVSEDIRDIGSLCRVLTTGDYTLLTHR